MSISLVNTVIQQKPASTKSQKEIVIKNYELWEGTHKFLFKGKVMMGPKFIRFIITFFLINLINILNFAFTQIVSPFLSLT
jgi:hypothetical protein